MRTRMNRIIGRFKALLPSFLAGLLLPLSFAPFHLPSIAIIAIAWLLYNIDRSKSPLLDGIFFGIAFFGFGISWIYNSIYDYGHLNTLMSLFITFSFVIYLSMFTGLTTWAYCRIKSDNTSPLLKGLVFASIWTLIEWLRSHLFTGFPWLQIGFGQIDGPLGKLLPLIGVYGTGFVVVLMASMITSLFTYQGIKRMVVQVIVVIIFLSLHYWQPTPWTSIDKKSVSIGIVQANLSMRDKWDERYFWHLMGYYQKAVLSLIHQDLIILPESAIPLPATLIADEISTLNEAAKKHHSTLLLGIPERTGVEDDPEQYFNSMMVLGNGSGSYRKQQLVPFGEYVPKPFQFLNNWGPLAFPNMLPGRSDQSLPTANKKPFAALICYELAYDHLIRQQLPQAQWLVSISDDGWFGSSLAPFQQLQMAQVRSLQTGRYQVMANNDGLSSIINDSGKLNKSLPPFQSGILRGEIYPTTGMTPWVYWGNLPIMLICCLILLLTIVHKIIYKKSSY